MDPDKPTVMRIIDGDERSLARRVDLALSGLPDGSRVDHFTYWYTGRPPLHEAAISPPGATTQPGAPRTSPPSAAEAR